MYHATSVSRQAVFFQGMGDLEVYPRPDGEVYVTGLPDRAQVVLDLPGETEVRADVVARLVDTIRAVSSSNALRDAPVTNAHACHLPHT